jgi:nucleoside-diphosphate-sugar epimerase
MTENKCIAVFGATGKVGREFVKMALDSGYSLRVLVRKRSSFELNNDNRVEVIEGDATNAEGVAAVVAGSDVVVSVLGNPSRNVQIMFQATENIMKAAAENPNPPRCLMVSSVGVGGSSWLIKMSLTLIGGRAGFKDYEDAEARIRSEKIVPFIVVRPYALTDKPANEQYKILPGQTAHFAKPIPRADVAKFFLACVKDASRDGSCVNIGGV